MKSIHYASASRQIRQLMLHEPEGEPRAVIHIVHGMAEHYARYYPLAEALCREGFAVAGYDQLGHGPQSAGNLGYLGDTNGWQKLVYDVDTTHTILCQHWPHAKQILLGHSMGSFVAREYAIQFGHEQLDGLVLSGSGYTPPGMCTLGIILSELSCYFGGQRKPSHFIDRTAFSGNNRGFRPARTKFDWLSRNPEVVDRYIADPYCGFAFTGGAYRDLFRGLKLLTLTERLNAVPKTLPILLISGSRDPIAGPDLIGPQTLVEQYKAAGVHDVTLKVYPEGRHEMFNEINRDEVISDLIDWISDL